MKISKRIWKKCPNQKGFLAILFMAILLLSIVTLVPATLADPGDGLVLWNKLGSQSEIENSEVGLDGTLSGGGFVGGMFGSAYSADHTEDYLVTFPKEVIPTDAGTIEFWAKLKGFPSYMEWWEKPYFVDINDGYSWFRIGFNGNDGGGNGGLVGGVGHGFMTGTGSYRCYDCSTGWTYEEVLGASQVEDWHHYALVWDEDGIPGVADGTKKVAVFLDGQLNSGRWYDYHGGDSELVPLTGGELGLIENLMSQGSVAIDNLIIWNYAKTDFSDRFTESPFIPATIDIDPDTLNLKSQGEWITAYIELLGSCDVNEIDVSTVKLITPSGDEVVVDSSAPATVGDYDSNGIPDLMVKFDRATVVEYLGTVDTVDDGTGIDEYVELTITGELTGGTPFEGSDTVRVIKKGK